MKIFNLSIRKTSNGRSIFLPSARGEVLNRQHDLPTFEIKKEKPVLLNVGGGKNHPRVEGWQIVDMRSQADIAMDIAKEPLPFEDNSVDVIFCSHTLEHIIPQRLDFVLEEFHRVMDKKNSLLRVSVPDINRAMKAYMENDTAFFDTSLISPSDPEAPIGGKLASWFYSTRLSKQTGDVTDMKGHVNCFDAQYMFYCLKNNGFDKVTESAFLQSSFPALRTEDFDRYPVESIFVEALLQS